MSHSGVSYPQIPENIFIELIKFATMFAEFSFVNIMDQQTDGVSMGSPLGAALVNIFLGFTVLSE